MSVELVKNEPALLLREGSKVVLIVADLHIGYERILFKKEQYSPNLTEKMIKHFEQLVSDTAPTEIIILGDLKHSIREFSRTEFRKVSQMLYRLEQNIPITIIRGNHDADLELVVPDNTQIVPASGLKLTFQKKQIYLLHGHALPREEFLLCDSLIMAHIHPTIAIPTIRGRYSSHQVWVKTRWQPTFVENANQWFNKELIDPNRLQNMKILIIPAFLDLLPGHILNLETTKEHLGIPLYRHLSMKDAEVIMLDHTPLGTLSQLTITK